MCSPVVLPGVSPGGVAMIPPGRFGFGVIIQSGGISGACGGFVIGCGFFGGFASLASLTFKTSPKPGKTIRTPAIPISVKVGQEGNVGQGIDIAGPGITVGTGPIGVIAIPTPGIVTTQELDLQVTGPCTGGVAGGLGSGVPAEPGGRGVFAGGVGGIPELVVGGELVIGSGGGGAQLVPVSV